MAKKSKLIATVIIPTYNEKGIIEKTIKTLDKTFSKIDDWQMKALVVDDTSPDKTFELVKKLQKKYPFLELLVNPDKAGLGAAYLKGMNHAFKELKSDVVFEFDADLSHDPKKIPLMLEKIEEGYDMVLGSRYIPGGSIPEDWGWHRKFLSVVGNNVIRLILTNFSIADWTGGYRAITKKVYQAVTPEMKNQRFSGYTFQVGFLHKAVKKNFKITEIPFHFTDRTIGQSKIGPEFIINNIMYLLRVRIKDIIEWRVFRFLVVGTVGALTQLLMANILPGLFAFEQFPLNLLPDFLAIEIAVLSNFILSNLWTFADRKLKLKQYPLKFLQFNLASAGSILIQTIIIGLGIRLFGIFMFTTPIIPINLSSRTLYHSVGIIIGMFWNFFAYNFFIWKKK